MTSKTNSRRPSASLIVAFVALFAALAGGAYAAKTELAPKNSVTSKAIVKKAVKSKHLAPGAVKSEAIAPGAVGADALAPGALSGSKLEVVTAKSEATIDADGTQNGGQQGVAKATATCPAGTLAIGGGTRWIEGSGGNEDKNVYINEAHLEGNSFVAEGLVDFGAQGNVKLQAEAYCLS